MRWRSIAPVVPEYSDNGRIGVVQDLGSDVQIGPSASWPFDWSINRSIGEWHRREIGRSDLWLVTDYEANSMGEASEEPGVSKQRRALFRLQEAVFALWLSKPSRLSFRICLHLVEQGDHFVCHALDVGDATIALDRYRHASLEASDLPLARRLLAAISTLPHEGPVWVAARSAFGAIREIDPTIRFLLFWIALEALFGPANQTRGAAEKLCRWAAAFLHVEGQSQRFIRRRLSASYKNRNDVVHGMRIGQFDPEDLVLPTEGAAMNALGKILPDPSLVAKFNGSGRETYLEGLILEARHQ